MDDAQLRTIWQQRQFKGGAAHLSQPLTVLMKYKLGRRVRQLSQIAGAWDAVIPPEIQEHTALESFRNGVLTIAVDSAARRFQLKTLLSAGLQKEIQKRFPGAIRRIHLIPGQFYSVDLSGRPRYDF